MYLRPCRQKKGATGAAPKPPKEDGGEVQIISKRLRQFKYYLDGKESKNDSVTDIKIIQFHPSQVKN